MPIPTSDQIVTRLRAIADENAAIKVALAPLIGTSAPPSDTPVLQALGMTKTDLMLSAATDGVVVGTITGATAGSTLSMATNAAMRLEGNSVKVIGTPVGGTYSVSVTETLSGATGSPKQSSFDILICGSLTVGGGGTVIPVDPLEGLSIVWEENFAVMPTTADWSFGAKPTNWDNGQYGQAWFAPLEGYNGWVPYSVTPEGYFCIRAKYNGGAAYPTYISGNISTARFNAGPPQSRDIMHGMRKGYFECRMKAPAVKGFWPAFWLLSDDAILNQVGHSVEIDIAELYMQWPTAYHAVLHGWNAGIHSPDTVIGNPDGGGPIPNLTTDFHTFGARVFDDVVVWYFDRVEVYRYPLMQSYSQEKFWALVTLAISSHEQEAVPPQFVDLLVDYVRFYG